MTVVHVTGDDSGACHDGVLTSVLTELQSTGVWRVQMAYSALITAALSGATVRQLSHWRKTGLLEPEYQTPTRVFYSYQDLVALRTFVYLRETLSLQKIRRAVNNLRKLGELEHLAKYKLVSHGNSIVLQKDDEDIDLVQHPEQGLLVRFEDVTGPFKTPSGIQVPDLARPAEFVSVNPSVRGGHPVIRGTRVPFDAVSSLINDGIPPEKIMFFYPKVNARAALSAVEFARYVGRFGTAAAA
jgi:uncharacterized protein (DUF433 family)/DNA-binding transcriptional MerR regulator